MLQLIAMALALTAGTMLIAQAANGLPAEALLINVAGAFLCYLVYLHGAEERLRSIAGEILCLPSSPPAPPSGTDADAEAQPPNYPHSSPTS